MDEVNSWRGSCEECGNWVFEDSGYGHCEINSCECANSITNKGYPTRFISRPDMLEDKKED